MDQPWYRQYFWLLVFGGLILVIAVISFAMVCFCRTQLSRCRTLKIRKSEKQKKKQADDQTVAVISVNSFHQPTAPPPIILPRTPDHQYDPNAGISTSPVMYAIVKKEKVTLQQQGIHPEYHGQKYDVNLHVPNKNDRYSNASYDSVGHITEIDYINTDAKNYTKEAEYIDVLADDDDDDDYDDVDII
ncbi:SLP adapter and CSK-interacting membrane protein [Leptodactylus fuscus]|uniref:SLP adapter and CSK-interacting membrane protein n=1 Tax=Leptodactylus fuscus TaxID=238119 RepID=UPI003F4E520F